MRFVFLAVLVLAAWPAWADAPGADACAAKLPPTARTMYDASLPKVQSGTAPRDALTSVARDIVLSGKASRDAARSAAEAAGECFRILKAS